MKTKMLWAAFACAALLGSCRADPPDSCIPRTITDCSCDGGGRGTAECQDDGRFGACFCSDFPPVPVADVGFRDADSVVDTGPADTGIEVDSGVQDTGTATTADAGIRDVSAMDTGTSTIGDAGTSTVGDAGTSTTADAG